MEQNILLADYDIAPTLPHALFPDLNMLRKNRFECLNKINNHPIQKKLPVIIYSPSCNVENANLLYDNDANYYICKLSDFEECKEVIRKAIMLVDQQDKQASKQNFLINKLKTAS